MTLPLPPADPAAAAAAAARFTAAHAARAEVGFRVLDSPVGRLVAAATDRGLVRLAYEDDNGGLDAVLQVLADRVSPRVLEDPARLERVAVELDEYFAGTRRSFEVPVDWRLVGAFGRRILDATAAIPFGAVSTYRDVAAAAGNAAASRAAGGALGANPVPIVVPCHRVLRTGGGLGGYTGGVHRKQQLLALEGVTLQRTVR